MIYDVTVTGSPDEAVAQTPFLWLIREGFPLLLTLTFTGGRTVSTGEYTIYISLVTVEICLLKIM